MKFSINLTKAAQDHVNDIGPKGLATQYGSDGSIPKERMEKYTAIDALWSENLMLGGYKPKEIVEYMLVSDNIKTRGLRENIFNPKLHFMGIAVGPHSTSGSVTVVDFVSKELAEGELPTIEVQNTDEIPPELQSKIDKMGLKGKVKVVPSNNPTIISKTTEEEIHGMKQAKPTLVSPHKFN